MKYLHIGWCNEDNHDKVWGIIELREKVEGYHGGPDPSGRYPQFQPPTYVTFWGRRGRKLQTKIWSGPEWQADTEFMKKRDKGYKEVSKAQLDSVYPEFERDLEKTAFWAALKVE